MELKQYFRDIKGFGVLSTADGEGNVDSAVYSRPHVMEDGTIAFIMNDRLSHHNLQSNPRASYLFREDGGGYRGKRFFLTKVEEEQDTERLKELKRRTYASDAAQTEHRFLVFFRIEKELPLIGPGEEPM